MDLHRLTLLKEYIIGKIAPILTDDKYFKYLPKNGLIDSRDFELALTLSENENREEPIPTWMQDANSSNLLVIRNIDLLNKEVQKKIVELLKYRKISTLELNPKVIIILTCKNLSYSTIDDEIISLTIQTI